MHTVLILGASGMLGNAVYRFLSEEPDCLVYGTVRNRHSANFFPPAIRERIVAGINVENVDDLVNIIGRLHPTVIINCVGVVKQQDNANDPLVALPINAILPHRLARLCEASRARLIHISTDCVFSGSQGGYSENDYPDASDLYGRSKLIGEVDYPNAITLRTSIVGHELNSKQGLVDWFLSQEGSIHGFRRAVFSGLTTVELSRVIAHYIMEDPELCGMYHVSGEPINKYDLLRLVAKIYEKDIKILPTDDMVINRSLSGKKFFIRTGYKPPSWNDLITEMRNFYCFLDRKKRIV